MTCTDVAPVPAAQPAPPVHTGHRKSPICQRCNTFLQVRADQTLYQAETEHLASDCEWLTIQHRTIVQPCLDGAVNPWLGVCTVCWSRSRYRDEDAAISGVVDHHRRNPGPHQRADMNCPYPTRLRYHSRQKAFDAAITLRLDGTPASPYLCRCHWWHTTSPSDVAASAAPGKSAPLEAEAFAQFLAAVVADPAAWSTAAGARLRPPQSRIPALPSGRILPAAPILLHTHFDSTRSRLTAKPRPTPPRIPQADPHPTLAVRSAPPLRPLFDAPLFPQWQPTGSGANLWRWECLCGAKGVTRTRRIAEAAAALGVHLERAAGRRTCGPVQITVRHAFGEGTTPSRWTWTCGCTTQGDTALRSDVFIDAYLHAAERHPRHTVPVVCHKLPIATEHEALAYLHEAAVARVLHRSQRRRERRVYQCDICPASVWHLTSIERRPPEGQFDVLRAEVAYAQACAAAQPAARRAALPRSA